MRACTREGEPWVAGNEPTLVCLSCGDNMKYFRTIPRIGVNPERLLFLCPSCKEVETKKI
jgi:hypothetical protein